MPQADGSWKGAAGLRLGQSLAAADEALQKRDFVKAIKGYEDAVFFGENTVATWLKLSQAWASLTPPNAPRALQSAYQAYRQDQSQDEPLLRLATLFEQLLDQPTQALAALQELKERNAPVAELDAFVQTIGAVADAINGLQVSAGDPLTITTSPTTSGAEAGRMLVGFFQR